MVDLAVRNGVFLLESKVPEKPTVHLWKHIDLTRLFFSNSFMKRNDQLQSKISLKTIFRLKCEKYVFVSSRWHPKRGVYPLTKKAIAKPKLELFTWFCASYYAFCVSNFMQNIIFFSLFLFAFFNFTNMVALPRTNKTHYTFMSNTIQLYIQQLSIHTILTYIRSPSHLIFYTNKSHSHPFKCIHPFSCILHSY